MGYRQRYIVELKVENGKKGIGIDLFDKKSRDAVISDIKKGEEMVTFKAAVPKKLIPGEVIVVTSRGYEGTEGAGYVGSHPTYAEPKIQKSAVKVGAEFPVHWATLGGDHIVLDLIIVYETKGKK